MSELNQAVESIERLAVQFEGMTLAAKVLRSIGSLEGHVKELETAREVLLRNLEELKTERDAASKAIDAEVPVPIRRSLIRSNARSRLKYRPKRRPHRSSTKLWRTPRSKARP